MDNNDESPKRRGEKNGNSGNLWYVVLAGIAIFLVVLYLIRPSSEELSQPELENLISSLEKDANGSFTGGTTVRRKGSDGKTSNIRYTNLHDVEIGSASVSGKVDRYDADSQDPSSATTKDQKIVTYLVRSENANGKIQDMLDEKGFTDYKAAGPPNFFEIYGGMLLVIALGIAFCYLMIRRIGGTGSAIAFGRTAANCTCRTT